MRRLVLVGLISGSLGLLSQPEANPSLATQSATTKPSTTEPVGTEPKRESKVYRRHCADCHGARGDGLGPAARYVFPRPRNFRRGQFRLVRAGNRVASAEDIRAAIVKGIPGTSMKGYGQLKPDELTELVAEVMEFRKRGLLERLAAGFRADGEEPDESWMRQVVQRRTTSLPAIAVPEIAPADTASLDRGRLIYRQYNCQACHGADGHSNLNADLVDDEGRPTQARNLVNERFKSGHEPEAMFVRIRLGMPGTPMPSSPQLTDQQLIDLVNYCRSLGTEPKRDWTNHQRHLLAIGVQPKIKQVQVSRDRK